MWGHGAATTPEEVSLPFRRQHLRLALILLAAMFAASSLAGWFAEGVYHEDDLTHYLFARWVKHDPRYLLDSWGRPGFTVPYSLVAWAGTARDGLRICRGLSAVISACTAWLAFCIARRMNIRHAWAAIPLLYLQPLFARLSSTTLTETPLGLYFALATWLLFIGRSGMSAAVMALAPVTRNEAIIILPIWALALWRQNARWPAYPLLLWAVVAHNLLSGWALGIWPALRWAQPSGADMYGSGTPLTFVPRLMQASGPVIACLALLGARQVRKRHWGWLLMLGSFTWFAAQTAIYMRGAYSSGGYARFLVPICPWLAVLAAAGLRPLLCLRVSGHRPLAVLVFGVVGLWALCELEWHWRIPVMPDEERSWATVSRIAAMVACLVLAVLACWLYFPGRLSTKGVARPLGGLVFVLLATPGLLAFSPLRLNPYQAQVREISSIVPVLAGEDQPLLTLNRWVYYWTDRWTPWSPITDCREWLDQACPGTLFVWDQRFCTEPVPGLSFAEMASRRDWQPIWPAIQPATMSSAPYLAFFERPSLIQASNRLLPDPNRP